MTIKVYTSGICGSQEVRKQQQRVLFILQSLPIDLQVIDVTEPGRDEDLTFMQETAKKHDKKTQLPPQIFKDNEYCGDYADFELANDDDDIMKFLKLESGLSKAEILKSGGKIEDTITQNGIGNHEIEKEVSEAPKTNGDVSNIDVDSSDIIMNSGDAADEQPVSAENESPFDMEENEVKPDVEDVTESNAKEEEESEEESE